MMAAWERDGAKPKGRRAPVKPNQKKALRLSLLSEMNNMRIFRN